jgi:hypothetical protein
MNLLKLKSKREEIMILTKYSPIFLIIMLIGNIKVLNACAKVEEGFSSDGLCKVGTGSTAGMIRCSSLSSTTSYVGCYVSTILISLIDII